MSRSRVLELLAELKLSGMLSAYEEKTASAGRIDPDQMLLDLLQAESAERHLRTIRYQLGQAKFPLAKDLDGFDFASVPVDEAKIRSLYEGEFLAGRKNIVFVGGTGTGKTHLAIAIASRVNRRNSPAKAAPWPLGWPGSTSWFSTSWATSRSPRTPPSSSST